MAVVVFEHPSPSLKCSVVVEVLALCMFVAGIAIPYFVYEKANVDTAVCSEYSVGLWERCFRACDRFHDSDDTDWHCEEWSDDDNQEEYLSAGRVLLILAAVGGFVAIVATICSGTCRSVFALAVGAGFCCLAALLGVLGTIIFDIYEQEDFINKDEWTYFDTKTTISWSSGLSIAASCLYLISAGLSLFEYRVIQVRARYIQI